jgi:hypothetical protein
VEHPPAEAVEVREPLVVPRDELAVELHIRTKRQGELREFRGHVPAAAALGAEAPAVCADEAAKPVELRLEPPTGAGGRRPGAGEHRFWEGQDHVADVSVVPIFLRLYTLLALLATEVR